MANKRAEVLKLIRAIPATLGVRDHATKRVLDALKEVVEHLLVDTYAPPGESVENATKGITELEAGENITIDKKSGGVRRITARDRVGGGGEEPIYYKGLGSVVVAGDEITLDGDDAEPGNTKVYGTDGSGAKGWQTPASGVPDGAADGDILAWDQTTDTAWEVNSMAGVADGDIMQWNAATKKWIKLTPTNLTKIVTDWQYDISTKQVQIKTRANVKVIASDAESGWTMPTGGQLVQES